MTIPQFQLMQQTLLQNGLWVLGFWAFFNLLLNGFYWLKIASESENKQFLLMNFCWNVVNMIIFTYSIVFLKSENIKTYFSCLKNQHFLETIFLVNAVLDLGYILFGLYLYECAKNAKTLDIHERNVGFGQSLWLQGGFLLVFDAVMFYLMFSHGKNLENLAKIA